MQVINTHKYFEHCFYCLLAVQGTVRNQDWENLQNKVDTYTLAIQSLKEACATPAFDIQTHLHQFHQLQKTQRRVMREVYQAQKTQQESMQDIESGLHKIKRLKKLVQYA